MNCLAVVVAYLALTTGYTLWLKHVVIADVICIALGFVLRVIFGVYAVQVQPTAWIAGCMFFLALFLGFGKRKAERDRANHDPQRIRPVLADYQQDSMAVLLAMSGAMTIISYSLFTVASHRNPTLLVTVVPVAYCVMRYLMQVMLHGRGESPESIVLSDVPLWIGILTWLGLCVAILYGDLHLFAEPR
jgi:decaprenyl-phosphate phosphoribosyltransferase